MEQTVTVLSWALLLGGAFFLLTGSLGMVRLPDVFTRMHAAGMTDTMGAGMIVVGLAVYNGADLVTVRLLLILAFLWFTSPIATHAVAKAALSGGLRPYTLGGVGAAADGGGGARDDGAESAEGGVPS
ncbi:MAG: monovalent cation/H(+) antiporter subunit G [Gemmatimonadetes bacterium]|nr:monovalent cation/H(+) antiporter subunit G [Gemmatimonadota bacterium]MYE15809.1 monovalent cation/H(+) antiporter subunit G [Gemmatimonadota bacterium]MYG23751.1 monovalent cation/H(+) antiporter subunit G [Gemmatimonadota bacterium]MYJ39698.1 monovalent cation/H(+) antiporter subunit G [Gemmatimonadota bacterium]